MGWLAGGGKVQVAKEGSRKIVCGSNNSDGPGLTVLIIYNKGAKEILISNSVLLLAFLFLKNTQNTETL